MSRRVVAGLLLALVAAGCGERPLERVGDISDRVVYGEDLGTTTAPTDDEGNPLFPVAVTDTLDWYNRQRVSLAGLAPEDVVAVVWERSDGINRYVQASPDEISLALPGIRFPAVMPEGSTIVTSQLVYDVATGTLDAIESAAFGVWTAEPYSRPREVAQTAVLRVGAAGAADATPGIDVAREDGSLLLEWTDFDYHYTLMCRSAVPEEVCLEMAESVVQLDEFATAASV